MNGNTNNTLWTIVGILLVIVLFLILIGRIAV